MPTYYFIYGNGDPKQAYPGGWTEVEAENMIAASWAYRAYHKKNDDGAMPYAFCYKEDKFRGSEMFRRGNFGRRCVERIKLTREIM